MRALNRLFLHWTNGSQDFHPLQAIAQDLDVTKALGGLSISSEPNTTSDPSGATVLAANLRRNATSLTAFLWQSVTHRTNNEHEAIFHALADLPRLRPAQINDRCTTLDADCIRALVVRSPSIGSLNLRLRLEHWIAVAQEIRSGSCRIETLTLSLGTTRTLPTGITSSNVIQALANSLEHNTSLQTLELYLWSGFSDGAVVALAKALSVNTHLRSLKLDLYRSEAENAWAQERRSRQRQGSVQVCSGKAYKAMSKMLKLKQEPLRSYNCPRSALTVASLETRKQRKLFAIENTLNSIGLGKLMATSPASKESWVHAFDKLNSGFVDQEGSSRCYHLGCLLTLLQLNPSICPMGDTANILSDLATPQKSRKSKRLQAASSRSSF